MPIKIQPFDEACAHAPWNLGSVAHTRVAPGRTLLPPLLLVLLLACLRAQLDLQVSGIASMRMDSYFIPSRSCESESS
jgi:hypothetical protein